MRPGVFIPKERAGFNLAKLKKEGSNFEVVVDPDMAIAYAKSQSKDLEKLRELVMSEKVFFDAQKAELASEEKIKSVFGTDDFLEIANKILLDGEIQTTTEYRASLREAKKKKLVELLHKTYVDPKTKIPHPIRRIENALEEAKFKIDEFRRAEEQLKLAVSALQPILPMSAEMKKLQIFIPANHASKGYGMIKNIAKVLKENWNSDGSITIEIEISASLATDLIDKLNSETHGSIDIKTR